MKAKILIIEDDESFFDAVELMMADHSVQIIWAETGAKGIQTYQQDPYGFGTVIIDYLLPDLLGTEVCQHLRKINSHQEILFASGHFDPDFLTDQLETGAAGFLKKGRPTGELRAQILRSLSNYEKKNRVIGSDNYEMSKAELELKSAGIVGRSAAMYAVLKQIESAKASPYPNSYCW